MRFSKARNGVVVEYGSVSGGCLTVFIMFSRNSLFRDSEFRARVIGEFHKSLLLLNCYRSSLTAYLVETYFLLPY